MTCADSSCRTGEATRQPNLFEFDASLPQVGDVVWQTWPWVGWYQLIIPYWQVYAIGTAHSMFLCRAVPTGLWPGELHWFERRDIEPLGVRLNVPSDKSLESEWQRLMRGSSLLARLSHSDGLQFIPEYRWDELPDPKPEVAHEGLCGGVQGRFIYPRPLDLDVPIVEALEARGLPWHMGAVTRGNFYEVSL